MRCETVIIGAGHAGLALSWHLAELGHEHVVLERGRVGERWHNERWDSMSLLTPNWLNVLPGQTAPEDPHGFTSRAAFAYRLGEYARSFAAPVVEQTSVGRVTRRTGGRYAVHTSRGTWSAANVVVATGDCDLPRIPAVSHAVPTGIPQLHVTSYRRPELLPPGGVLVVGAGPSGQQVARDLCHAGRDVVLCVGRHARAPRRYRGEDVFYWLDAIGSLDTSIDDVPDSSTVRTSPSIPLTGSCGGVDIDLGVLSRRGVTVTGRLLGFDDRRAHFAGDLEKSVGEADSQLAFTLSLIDAHIERECLDRPEATPIEPISLPDSPAALDLAARGIGAVIWATGYRRRYDWLQVPGAIGPDGELLQHHGVSPVRGLFTMGIRFQSHRSSHFIGGVGQDAAQLATVVTGTRREQPSPRRRVAQRPSFATG
jgi:putative flavoprotein involved in K+ transport